MADVTLNTNSNVNAYAPAAATTTTETTKAAEKTTAQSAEDKAKDAGVVFEKSKETKRDSANQIYNRDSIVAKLKADADARAASMQSLVEKLLGKQKNVFDIANLSDDELGSMNLYDTFSQLAQKASPEDIAKAQADVAEDGYWGVNQTSDRLVSMAIALSGGDTDKADEMMDAIQKGFDKATKAWGRELPQISQDTLKATMDKMNDWKNGVTTAEDYNKYLA